MGFSGLTAAALLASAPINFGGAQTESPVPPVATAPVVAAPAGPEVQPVAAPSPDPVLVPQAAAPSPAAAETAAAEAAASPPTGPGIDQDDLAASDERDITVRARRASPGDPMAAINAKSFAITEAVDNAVLGPAAMAVENNVPKPITDGLHNFLYNIHEPVAFLNFLLQLKPGKAAETLGRFTINSTLGIGGLFDVAKKRPFKLPYRTNGFAYTLGYYGIGPGPFLFLPLFGSTSLRDLIGDNVDRLVVPLAFSKPFNRPAYFIPAGVFRTLDRRADFDNQLRALRQSADPYVARREYYLQLRQAEIDHLRGKPPAGAEKPANPPK